MQKVRKALFFNTTCLAKLQLKTVLRYLHLSVRHEHVRSNLGTPICARVMSAFIHL